MDSRCARARARRARVELQLHQGAGVRQHRELGAFVRYCVSRIERELGEIEHWSVTIAPVGGEFTSVVAIKDARATFESTGLGMDGPLAAWDALCKLEQLLREARARRAGEGTVDPDRESSTWRHVAAWNEGTAD